MYDDIHRGYQGDTGGDLGESVLGPGPMSVLVAWIKHL